jgi:hypothetical protein
MGTRLFLASVVLLFALGGCAKKPPAVTFVEGTLLLNNEPLPFAHVEFYPELSNFGSEMNSSAETDEKGHFTLICHATGESGAAVATHRVVVIEASPPKEMRGMDAQSQTRLAEHMKKLTNRPIPGAYGNYSNTPLRVTVTADQRSYTLELKRDPISPSGPGG